VGTFWELNKGEEEQMAAWERSRNAPSVELEGLIGTTDACEGMAELQEKAEATEDVDDFGEFSWNEPSEARRLTRGEELTVREHEGLMWLDA
jgi:hypothetical protein